MKTEYRVPIGGRGDVALFWTAAVAILLAPAIYNGFPLIFPDTSAYLGVSYGSTWTLDRSAYYGLLFKPLLLSLPTVPGLWTMVIVQAAIIAAVLAFLCRKAGLRAGMSLLVVAAACLTSLPWHSSQLMPDAFTGPLVILLALTILRDPAEPGTPLLWLACGILTMLHFTHLGLFVAVAVCAVAAVKMSGASIKKRSVAAGVTLAFATAAYILPYGMIFGRWSVSPMSSMFLFARMYEDGPARSWLANHCGRDAPASICAMDLPNNSQQLLWENSPLGTAMVAQVKAGRWNLIDDLHIVTSGTMREYPGEFLANSLAGGARQFISFGALDDLCPGACHLTGFVEEVPGLGERLEASRQVQGALPKAAVRTIAGAAAWLSLLLILPMLVASIRRRDTLAICLLLSALGALVANALMGGALSNVNDRYQSRLIYLLPILETMAALRWLSFKVQGGAK